MGVEKKSEDPKLTVKMKFVGMFRGVSKTVELPIPLIANSEKLTQTLVFSRVSDRQGPAFCEVPLEWAGALLDVGGNWQVVEKLTPDLQRSIEEAHTLCKDRMQKFSRENELVEA